MPTLPSGLTYGTVSWNVVQLLVDAPGDPDSLPEMSGVNGTVTIAPNVTGPFLATTSSPPVTIYNGPYTFSVLNGVMQDAQGNTHVNLVATDCPVINPQNWNYKATFALAGSTRGSFTFALPTNTNVDLTSVAPVSASAGVDVTSVSYVKVTTGSESRPSAGLVLWVGGSTQPTNMGASDVWLQGSATYTVKAHS